MHHTTTPLTSLPYLGHLCCYTIPAGQAIWAFAAVDIRDGVTFVFGAHVSNIEGMLAKRQMKPFLHAVEPFCSGLTEAGRHVAETAGEWAAQASLAKAHCWILPMSLSRSMQGQTALGHKSENEEDWHHRGSLLGCLLLCLEARGRVKGMYGSLCTGRWPTARCAR